MMDIATNAVIFSFPYPNILPLPFSVSQEPLALNVIKTIFCYAARPFSSRNHLLAKIAHVTSLSHLERSVSYWETFGWVFLKFFPSNIHNRSSYQGFIALTPLSVVYPDLCLHFQYFVFDMVSVSYVGTLLLFKDTTCSLESSEPWIFLTASTSWLMASHRHRMTRTVIRGL